MKSQLIILEGGDGTGKSTQAEKLCSALRARKHKVLYLREPGSTAISEKIREILLQVPEKGCADISPEAEVFLYMAARAQLFGEVIAPALDRGETVVDGRLGMALDLRAAHGGDSGMLPQGSLTRFEPTGLDLAISIDELHQR